MNSKNLVEDMAQTQFKYQKLFEDQAGILRQDPAVYQKAYDHAANSEGIGEPWMPKPDEKDAYMLHLEEICKTEPKTPEE
jgi:hypothetical protein